MLLIELAIGSNAPVTLECLLGQHVLVADDNEDLAESSADLLASVSLTKLTAALAFNGRQSVLAAISAAPADVIVMNIEMPVTDGFGAAVAIRTAMGTRMPYPIAISGSSDHIALARAGGMFDDAMRKPLQSRTCSIFLQRLQPELMG